MKLETIRVGATLKMPKLPACLARTKYNIMGAYRGAYQTAVHKTCLCNEEAALRNRHLIERNQNMNPNYVRQSYAKYRARLALFTKPLQQLKLQEVIEAYSGSKKRAYIAAASKLTTEGLRKTDAYVRMFVKTDKLPMEQVLTKAPRAIQYRSKKYTLAAASYLKPIEEHYYALPSGYTQTRSAAKNLNQIQRAELFMQKVAAYMNPVYLLLDHSKFDSTISKLHISSTHSYYRTFYPKSQLLNSILSAQLYNKGFSGSGIRYSVRGTRMSGDYDTGLGNTYVNAGGIETVMADSGITKYDYLLDGDDSVIIIEASDLWKYNHGLWMTLGFDTKKVVVTELEDVEFCQCKLVNVNGVYRFIRNPRRVISHSMVCLKRYRGPRFNNWRSAVGMCELALNQGVPVLQDFAHSLASVPATPKFEDDMIRRMGDLTPTKTVSPITKTTRLSFFKAFGITPWMQVRMEQEFVTAFRRKTSTSEKLARLDSPGSHYYYHKRPQLKIIKGQPHIDYYQLEQIALKHFVLGQAYRSQQHG